MPVIPFPRLVTSALEFWSAAHVGRFRTAAQQIGDRHDLYASLSGPELLHAALRLRDQPRSSGDLSSFDLKLLALAVEAVVRKLKIRPHQEQILAALALVQPAIVQMETGEGKTLVIPLAAALHVTAGNPVTVACANEYLAKRDFQWMCPVYEALGISVGLVTTGQDFRSKRRAYSADVVYGDAATLAFDYLSSTASLHPRNALPLRLSIAILDEIDVVLIDHGNIQYSTGETAPRGELPFESVWFATETLLRGTDFTGENNAGEVQFSGTGHGKLNRLLSTAKLSPPEILFFGRAALAARWLLHKDVNYITSEDRIIRIDESSGRAHPDSRFKYGIQQFLELKENVPFTPANIPTNSINMSSFFSRFKSVAGLSGSARHNSIEYKFLFGLDVLTIPSHQPSNRDDLPDVVFRSRDDQLNYAVHYAKEHLENNGAVLIGTTNVRDAEDLGAKFSLIGVQAALLTARNDKHEASTIAHAGHAGKVTVAARMAGRGVDIQPSPDVLSAGGVLVIGVGRSEDRRLDDQLRGRTGRQGQPGRSVFLISPDDEISSHFQSPIFQVSASTAQGGKPVPRWLANVAISKTKAAQSALVLIRYYMREYDRMFYSQIEKARDDTFSRRHDVLFGSKRTTAAIRDIHKYIFEALPQTRSSDLLLIDDILHFGDAKELTSETPRSGELRAQELSERFARLFRARKTEIQPYATVRIRTILLRSIDLAWMDYLESTHAQFQLLASLTHFWSGTRAAYEMAELFVSSEQRLEQQRLAASFYYLMRINQEEKLQVLKYWRGLGTHDQTIIEPRDGISALAMDTLPVGMNSETDPLFEPTGQSFFAASLSPRKFRLDEALARYLANGRASRYWSKNKAQYLQSVLAMFVGFVSQHFENEKLPGFLSSAADRYCKELHLQGIGWMNRRRQRSAIAGFLSHICIRGSDGFTNNYGKWAHTVGVLNMLVSPFVIAQSGLIAAIVALYVLLLRAPIPFLDSRHAFALPLPLAALDIIFTGGSWQRMTLGIAGFVPFALAKWKLSTGVAEFEDFRGYLLLIVPWALLCSVFLGAGGLFTGLPSLQIAIVVISVILACSVLTFLAWAIQQTELRSAIEVILILNCTLSFLTFTSSVAGRSGLAFAAIVGCLYVLYELSGKWCILPLSVVRVGAYDAIKRTLTSATLRVSLDAAADVKTLGLCAICWASCLELFNLTATRRLGGYQGLMVSALTYAAVSWFLRFQFRSRSLTAERIGSWLGSNNLALIGESQEDTGDEVLIGRLRKMDAIDSIRLVVLVCLLETAYYGFKFEGGEASGILVCAISAMIWAAFSHLLARFQLGSISLSSGQQAMSIYDGIEDVESHKHGKNGVFKTYLKRYAVIIAWIGIASSIAEVVELMEKMERWISNLRH